MRDRGRDRVKNWRRIFISFIFGLPSFAVFAAEQAEQKFEIQMPAKELKEFVDEISGKDFQLRSTGNLRITNLRGSVAVQGWAFDKIRVKAKRKVLAADEEEAGRLRAVVDFRFSTSHKGEIELSAEYGKGQSIKDRVRERNNPRASMDIQIFAPPHLMVSVLTIAGDISVSNRSADVDVRTTSGKLKIENIETKQVSVLCADCESFFKNVKSSIHAIGGGKTFELSHSTGKKIYVETHAGVIDAKNIQGEQFYITQTGLISGQYLRGSIEFASQEGKVDLKEIQGCVSGRSDLGDITVGAREWVFQDKALIESQRGNILITLPPVFSGELDVRSSSGSVSVEFPLRKNDEESLLGPLAAHHLIGKTGQGGELLKVVSDKGDVRIQRGS